MTTINKTEIQEYRRGDKVQHISSKIVGEVVYEYNICGTDKVYVRVDMGQRWEANVWWIKSDVELLPTTHP